MRTRLVVAALLTVGATLGWAVGASTQEATTPPDIDVPVDVPQVVDEQAMVQFARLMEHHARVVEQGERVADSQLEYQERTARQLGDRAPTETIPPMATVPPLDTPPPPPD